MNGCPHLTSPVSDRLRSVVLRTALCACFVGGLAALDSALAQEVTDQPPVTTTAPSVPPLTPPANTPVPTGQEPVTVAGPSAPPLTPPVDAPLPTGIGMTSIGPFLLSPSLDTYTFYDSNVHGSPTTPLSGPGFHIHPSILADWNTGIHDTKFYGNIDSEIYPTLDYLNNTFNKQAGVIETYSPLRDLTITTQANYAHNTLANVLTNSIPSPITSSANPLPAGAAGLVAVQQTVVNPNDVYTATANISKLLNRAFVNFGGTFVRTEYDNTPSQNLDTGTYYGSGGVWLTPQFYGFADALDANSVPATGSIANSYRARGGIGSAQIWLFQGSVYYGHQGTAVDGDGSAGGDIYGGQLTYYATPLWNMSVNVDRQRNRSDISASTNLGLGGLPLSGIGITTSSSVQVTSIAYKTNYKLTEQATLYGVVSDNRIAYFDSSRVDNSWLASAGISYQLRDNLSLSLDYQYTRYLSPEPDTSLTRNLVSLGAHYRF